MERIFYSIAALDSVVLGFCKLCSEIYLNGRKCFALRTFLVSEKFTKMEVVRKGGGVGRRGGAGGVEREGRSAKEFAYVVTHKPAQQL